MFSINENISMATQTHLHLPVFSGIGRRNHFKHEELKNKFWNIIHRLSSRYKAGKMARAGYPFKNQLLLDLHFDSMNQHHRTRQESQRLVFICFVKLRGTWHTHRNRQFEVHFQSITFIRFMAGGGGQIRFIVHTNLILQQYVEQT